MTVAPYFVADATRTSPAPTFRTVDATVVDGTLSFAVEVDDERRSRPASGGSTCSSLEDPAPARPATWQAVDLVRTAGTDRWSGSIPVAGDEIEYLVQAVDAAGNVAITTNKALNFRDDAAAARPARTDAPAQARPATRATRAGTPVR